MDRYFSENLPWNSNARKKMNLVHKYTNKSVKNIFDENVNVDILVALVFVELN